MRGRVEKAAGSGLDAVALAAVVDGVEIHLENLRLRVAPIEVDGEHRLLDLALNGGGWMGTDEHLLDQLLADRAPALTDLMARVVGHGGARDAAQVDAVIRPEGAVLDGDRCLADV